MKPELSREERLKLNEKIIAENDKFLNLPVVWCPRHGYVRDDGSHRDCRPPDPSRPWHQLSRPARE